MTVGDAVVVSRIRHDLKRDMTGQHLREEFVGVITDIRRVRYSHEDDIEREWRVFTTDEMHYWYHEDDIAIPQ